MSDAEEILARLRTLDSAENRAGMARFGIRVDNALGISVTTLRSIGREVLRPMKQDAGTRHALAAE